MSEPKQSKFTGRLVARNIDVRGYTSYLFEDIDNHRYVLCVQFPFWDQEFISVNDIGDVTIRHVSKEDTYTHPKLGKQTYKYDGNHFLSFVEKECCIEEDSLIINLDG